MGFKTFILLVNFRDKSLKITGRRMEHWTGCLDLSSPGHVLAKVRTLRGSPNSFPSFTDVKLGSSSKCTPKFLHVSHSKVVSSINIVIMRAHVLNPNVVTMLKILRVYKERAHFFIILNDIKFSFKETEFENSKKCLEAKSDE